MNNQVSFNMNISRGVKRSFWDMIGWSEKYEDGSGTETVYISSPYEEYYDDPDYYFSETDENADDESRDDESRESSDDEEDPEKTRQYIENFRAKIRALKRGPVGSLEKMFDKMSLKQVSVC